MPKGTDAFSAFDDDAATVDVATPTSQIIVPNQHPTILSPSARIALIGEAPGQDEESQLKPFVGMSGRFLDSILSSCGIVRACCFVGNVCQIRPPKNDISAFDYDGVEIQSGLVQLQSDLEQFKPTLCVLLGKTALFAASGLKNLGDWRGSFFVGTKPPFVGIKCLATYHPAACLRNYEWTPLLRFDLSRCAVEGRTSTWIPPSRTLRINLSFNELIHELTQIQLSKPLISCDIEGGINSLSCIGVATSPHDAFIIPFERLDRSSVWDATEESTIWKLVGTIMADRDIPKVWQNGLYDRFVLQWGYNVLVRCSQEDTMLKWWELYCELEKSLGFQCSILTNQPFYKADRKTTDQETFYKYCCTDACVTYEINQKLTPLLTKEQKEHYKFNNEALNFLLYAELRGIRYDQPTANSRLCEVQTKISILQNNLDEIASSLGAIERMDYTKSNTEILQVVQAICCYKKDPSRPKKGEEEGYYKMAQILSKSEALSEEECGTISILCGLTMNTKSTKFKNFLYGTCGLPTQWKKDLKTKELRPTTDYESLLKLSKSHNHPVLGLGLELSRLRTRAQMLAIKSSEGRMHCSYNLVGSETGRVTSSKSIIGGFGKGRVGANLQTIPDDWDVEDQDSPLAQGMRDLFLADEGCYLFKCDLKGADGWTIGAYMSFLGDPTMLDDLKFGLKPAQIVAFILKHGATQIQTYAQDRPKLKELVSEIKKDDWEYFVSKQGIWGTCYTMGPRKLAERVFIESEGKVNLTERQARDFQSAIYVRYRVKLWQDWMQRHLTAQSYPAKLAATNGQIRKFFGRNSFKNCEILGEALAHLPQVYTTYATLKAARRLWFDEENQIGVSNMVGSHVTKLRIEPLHQVHDELLCQARIEDTTWAIDKLKSYFDNPIQIANQTITIPFDGAYGTAWSMDENHKKGEIK
jgi:DNA polymerase